MDFLNQLSLGLRGDFENITIAAIIKDNRFNFSSFPKSNQQNFISIQSPIEIYCIEVIENTQHVNKEGDIRELFINKNRTSWCFQLHQCKDKL